MVNEVFAQKLLVVGCSNSAVAENIRIEPEVMRHYGREDLGVAIPEGGGYIGTLNVYHELHCIVSIPAPPRLVSCPAVSNQHRNDSGSTAIRRCIGRT